MAPKGRFVLVVFAMVLTYMALIGYFVFSAQGSPVHFPYWFPYVGLSYFLAIMIVGTLVARRIFRNTAKLPPTRTQSILASIGRLWNLYLVVAWSGLFIYGVRDALKGELPLRRAIPAGILLLAFIGLFAWSLLRDYRMRKRNEI